MKLITYKQIGDRYFKDGNEISKKEILQLRKSKQKELEINGQCRTRNLDSNKQNKSSNINNQETSLSKGEQRILSQNKDKYMVIHSEYKKTGKVIELLRKNKLGFYNTIKYLKDDKEETINKAILEDISKINNEKEKTKNNKS